MDVFASLPGQFRKKPTRAAYFRTDRIANYQLAHRIAIDHGVTLAMLIGRSRIRKVVEARYDCFRRYHEAGFSAAEIGRRFDRDHTTVLYALNALATKRTER